MGVAGGRQDGREAEASRKGRGRRMGALVGRAPRGACRQKRSRRGFTLMETMAVVAVMVILMGVAFPAIFSIRDNLRMMDLDAKAQQIYNATQNRLEALKASGQLGELEKAIPDSRPNEGDPFKPADYEGEMPEGQYITYVVSADDATNQYLFTDGSSSDGTTKVASSGSPISKKLLSNGAYVIELSPKTGEVYAVFYWEPNASGFYPGAKECGGVKPDADNVEDYYKAVRDNRSRDARKPYFVGYWGGNGVGSYATAKKFDGDLGNTKLEGINDEEYYLRITNDDFAQQGFDPSKLNVTVTLDQQGGVSASYTFNAQRDAGMISGSTEMDIILDSMRKDADGNDLSFANIVQTYFRDADGNPVGVAADGAQQDWNKKYFSPGANLDIDVSVSYDGGNPTSLPGLTNQNLLLGAYDQSSNTVTVSAVRHLNNLRQGRSKFDYGQAYYLHYNKIVISKDIQFDGSLWKDDAVSLQSRVKAGRDDATGLPADPKAQLNPLADAYVEHDESGKADPDHTPHQFFAPIVLAKEFNNGNGGSISVDDDPATGRPAVIRNMVIGDKDERNDESRTNDSGLFSTLNVNVDGVNLESPTVYGNDQKGKSGSTGALAGSLGKSGEVVQNCSITTGTASNGSATIGRINGTTNVGGLIGYAPQMVIHDCQATVDVSGTGSGSTGIGGFIGTADGTTLNDCSVGVASDGEGISSIHPSIGAADGSAATNVGGFVGYINNANVNNQATPGDSSADGYRTIVAASVSGTSNVGGFAGNAANWTNVRHGIVNGRTGNDPSFLTVSAANANAGGFIGSSSSFIARDCSAEIDVSGPRNVGGFVGSASGGGSFTSCEVGPDASSSETEYPTITGAGSSAGGFVGDESGITFESCAVVADTSGQDLVGGFAGSTSGGSFASSSVVPTAGKDGKVAYPSVIGTGTSIGGFAGRYSSSSSDWSAMTTAKDCDVSVNVSGKGSNGSMVGGFIGRALGGSSTNCNVNGKDANDASGSSYLLVNADGATTQGSDEGGSGFVGGFIGIASDYSAQNCAAEIDVHGENRTVGGFVGEMVGSTMQQCAAKSEPGQGDGSGWTTISGGESSGRIGGFVGRMNGDSNHGDCKATECYAANNVDGSAGTSKRAKDYGGFVGRMIGGKASITNCYSSGYVKGNLNVGGFLGGTNLHQIEGCFTTSDVYGDATKTDGDYAEWGVGGFVGGIERPGSMNSESSLENDAAYGRVLKTDGGIPESGNYGGFFGADSAYDGKEKLDGSTWLKMQGHNYENLLSAAANQPGFSTWDVLTAPSQNGVRSTHPFAARLKTDGAKLPFTYMDGRYGRQNLDYYGDWPIVHQVTWQVGGAEKLREYVEDGTALSAPDDSLNEYSKDGNDIVVKTPDWSGVSLSSKVTDDITISVARWSTTSMPNPEAYLFKMLADTGLYQSTIANKDAAGSNPGMLDWNGWAYTTTTNGGFSASSEQGSGYLGGLVSNANASASLAGLDLNAWSWSLYVQPRTIVNGEGNVGKDPDNWSHEGNYVAFLGPKLRQGQTSATVWELDLGRRSSNQPSLRRGTVSVTTASDGSLMFGDDFSPSTDWISL